MAICEVVEKTKITERTYQRWEDREVDSIREANLIRVLARLGVSLEEFLGEATRSGKDNEFPIFSDLASDAFRQSTNPLDLLTLTERIDRTLLSVLHAERGSVQNKEVYRDLLYGGLIRRGLSLSKFTNAIQQIEQERCHPRVTLDLDGDMRALKIRIGEIPALEIAEPCLLWECSCLPDELTLLLRKRGFKPKPCLICAHRHGKKLMDLTSREFVQLRFLNTNIRWRQSRPLWPPSIDSVIMLRNLRDAGAFNSTAESLLDLGCGTGVLGITFVKHNHCVRRLGLADWLLTPLLHAALNAELNLKQLPVQWQLHLGMFDDWMAPRSSEPYDLVLCTPPYLPDAAGFVSVRTESPVAGTELVNFVIQKHIAREAYVTLSTLVVKSARKLARKESLSLELIGNPVPAPFRVPAALRCPAYIQSLLNAQLLEYRPENRFPLWHQVMTFLLKPSSRRISKLKG